MRKEQRIISKQLIKLQSNYIHITEKEAHRFRKQNKILLTKYRITKQKIRIQPPGKCSRKVKENLPKLKSHDKQFHSGAILKE